MHTWAIATPGCLAELPERIRISDTITSLQLSEPWHMPRRYFYEPYTQMVRIH